MDHVSRWTLGMAIVLAGAAGEARAQYYGGYGGYGGWGGWGGGSTVQGDFARGAGFFAMGAGQYNLSTAQAASINADTIMRWNEYMFLSQQEANRREYVRRARVMKRDAAAGETIYARVRDNPQDHDIQTGDALNAIRDQLTNPKIHSTALRLIRTPISGQAIREIPFENASEAVTLSLHQLSGETGWPAALQGPIFAEERAAYRAAIANAVKEDEEGALTQQTLQELSTAIAKLRAKLEANKPATPVQYGEAINYIKTLIAMSQMLQKPQVDKVLAELDSIKETTLGSLLAFMHAYNLRFGPATNQEQRTVYTNLYPLMDEARDKILKEAEGTEGNKPVARADTRHPVDFFSGLHLEHLEGRSTSTPPPPQPRP
jgi:hypothetical protein